MSDDVSKSKAAQGRDQSGLGFSPSPLADSWTKVQTTFPQATERSGLAPSTEAQQRVEVLAVEDNRGDARLILEYLAKSGDGDFRVRHAVTLAETLTMLTENAGDLVLLDLFLPDSQGVDTLKQLRQAHPDVPVVVLSGLGVEAAALEAIQEGAQDYLIKGEISGSALQRAIRYAIERKRAEQSLRESEEKHRLLFESSRDAIMTLAPPSWRFTAGNPATVAMFRTGDEARFVAVAPWQLSPEFQADGRRSDEKAKAMIETAMREGSHFFEWTHKRLDGEEFPATVLLTRFQLAGRTLLQATVRDISEQKRAEQERETLARERVLLLDCADEGIYGVDREGRCTFFNKAGAQMLGYAPEELVGKSLTDKSLHELIHHRRADGSPYPADECPIHDSFRTGVAHRVDSEVFWRRDGTPLPVEYSAHPMMEEGVVTGAVVVFSDITERKQAETALRENKERLALATRAANVGIWDLDLVNNKLVWDDAMYRLYGVTPDQFTGGYEAWQAGVHSEDLPRAHEEVQMALRGEKEFDTEFRVVWPDKSIRHIKAAALVQRDAAGRPVRMLGTNWDITERKRAEEAVKKSERLYRGAIEAAGAVPYYRNCLTNAYDFAGTGIEALTGCSREQFTPAVWESMANEIALLGDMESLPEEAARRGFWNGEFKRTRVDYRVATPGGAERWIADAAVPVFDGHGKVIGSLGLLQDITERKRAEEAVRRQTAELRARNEELERFNRASVGRELRMIELKREINEFCRQAGQPPRYPVHSAEEIEKTDKQEQ